MWHAILDLPPTSPADSLLFHGCLLHYLAPRPPLDFLPVGARQPSSSPCRALGVVQSRPWLLLQLTPASAMALVVTAPASLQFVLAVTSPWSSHTRSSLSVSPMAAPCLALTPSIWSSSTRSSLVPRCGSSPLALSSAARPPACLSSLCRIGHGASYLFLWSRLVPALGLGGFRAQLVSRRSLVRAGRPYSLLLLAHGARPALDPKLVALCARSRAPSSRRTPSSPARLPNRLLIHIELVVLLWAF